MDIGTRGRWAIVCGASGGPGRGRAEEYGAACAFLCSAHAGFIIGQTQVMDGGSSLSTI